jgi:hypothetical protein
MAQNDLKHVKAFITCAADDAVLEEALYSSSFPVSSSQVVEVGRFKQAEHV